MRQVQEQLATRTMALEEARLALHVAAQQHECDVAALHDEHEAAARQHERDMAALRDEHEHTKAAAMDMFMELEEEHSRKEVAGGVHAQLETRN